MACSKPARNELSLAKKYDVVKLAQKNPSLGIRKIAEYFDCGKTQISRILKKKSEIVEQYEKNASSGGK